MARGGNRPTAPQNNPMNINGRGGNGQSGTQAARYVSGLPYGEGQELMQTQQSAPLAAAPGIEQSRTPMASASAAASLIPMNAPTQRPDEPITFGADAGVGPGLGSLGLPSVTERTVAQILSEVAQYDTTGEVRALYERALLGGF
jgi:hypothetical protein